MSGKFVNTYITLKTDRPRKDNTYPLYLRLTIDRRIKNYPLKKHLKKEDWDENNRQAKTQYEFHRDLNLLLSQKITTAKQVIYRLENDNKPVTFNNFEAQFFGKVTEGDYFTYANKQLELWKPRLSKDSYKQYETEIGKIKKFNNTFYLSDIDNAFLSRYDSYMRKTLGNKPNTVAKSMKVLRTFVIAAYNEDLIDRNPFKTHKLKWEDSNRTFLTMEELDKLEVYYKRCTNSKIRNVLGYFLFCCYTGLRYGGVEELEYKHIRNGIIYMHGAEIPVSDRAAKLIDPERNTGKVFRVVSNTKSNDYLKLAFAADGVSIEREDQILSFHSSRHTFATLSLNLGMSMDAVQAILDHHNQKTTRIYAKLLNKTKIDAMKVWDTIDKEKKA